MSIAAIVTRGFGSGGSIGLAVTAGYAAEVAPPPTRPSLTRIRGRYHPIISIDVRHDPIARIDGRHDPIIHLEGCADMSVTENFPIYYGEAKVIEFTVKKAVETPAGDGVHYEPEDITGWAISFQMVESWAEEPLVPLVTKTTAAGGVSIVDGPAGVGRVTLPTADTRPSAGAGGYGYSISRTDSGSEAVLSDGTIQIKAPRVAGS